MAELTTTVQMDSQGRLYVPKAVRESLGIVEESATLEIDVELVERHGENE